jgi:signal transduction histidine kinase
MHPIENSPECMQCHDPQDRLLGLLLTDLSIAPLESALRADLYEHLGWWGLTLLFTILVVNLVLSRFVLSRLEHLAVDIRRFGQNQGSPLSNDDHPDEIGQLSAAFHTMASHVQARSDENLRLSDSLREQNSLRGELLQRLITAQEAERRRIARELHDDLGQRLGGLGFHVQALDGMIAADPIRAREQLGPIRALIGETTSHMYDLIRDLRPSALDDLGLEAALSSLAQRVLGSRGIEYRLQTNAAGQRMPPAIETTLYRVFQEAMTNIVRHSGASEVVITLARHDHILEATIRDNGCGFEPAAVKANDQNERGLGLLGMNERVTQCGGAITIASGPGAGTEIFVRVPLDKGADYE